MSDLDRFVEFLGREAPSYHVPPPTPSEAMWPGIERALREEAAAPLVGDGPLLGQDRLETTPLPADDPLVMAETVYHEPTEPPRDAMWARIEAAWTLRRTLPPSRREAGLDELEVGPAVDVAAHDESKGRRSRPVVARWVAGLAIAASLVIGVVLGRGTAPVQSVATRAATDPSSALPGRATAAAGDAEVASTRDVAASDAPRAQDIEPLETSVQLAAADPEPGAPAPGLEAGSIEEARSTPERSGAVLVVSRSADRRPADSGRRYAVARQATNLYLGRAETLLTSFRTQEAGSNDVTDLARWARELLGETRLLLDLPVNRSPDERALLEEIELVLAQIAGLGPGVPDFEREVIEDGLDRLGTVTRLREAMPQIGT